MRFWVGLFLLTRVAAGQLHAPVPLKDSVQDKNFFLLSALTRDPELHAALKSDVGRGRLAAAKDCANKLACYAEAFRFSDAQIAEGGAALAALYGTSPAVRRFADGALRESGMYVRYHDSSGPDLLRRAWIDCARGINRAIDVYALGKPPRYPAIDGMTYEATPEVFGRALQVLAAAMEDDRANLDLFFAPSLRFAVEVITLNQRDEAGRFEPMEKGENAAAFRRMGRVDWAQYEYSVIVVPGAGNDRSGVHLSPHGKLRDEIALKRYREGKAPFLLVSGGFVHPARTEFSEAIEMKRDLMTRFGVPEEAIIVDPHARHTTTNMRNAARLMYRYGMPFEKKALVTSDPSQSAYIESAVFAKRCVDELGYLPYKLGRRVSDFDQEFTPAVESLHADPSEPLDP